MEQESVSFTKKMTILNKDKKRFNPDYDIPMYIFEGTYEEYLELKKQEKTFLNKNVFRIDPSIIKV